MTGYSLEKIQPTRRNATKMQYITPQDLRLMNMKPEEIAQTANPENDRLVNRQLEWLKGNEQWPKRRMGAFAVDGSKELQGFSVVGEWSFGNQQLYESTNEKSPAEKLAIKIAGKILHNHLPTRPLALLSLVVDRDLGEDQQSEIAEGLLDDVVNYADGLGKEIRGSYYIEDPSSALYLKSGFSIVDGKVGQPVGTVVQQLMSRKITIAPSSDIPHFPL